MRIPVSVFIITRNEAQRIGRTLAAVVDLSDDIIVVDSGSTDGTQAIAAAHGARVVFNPWSGYGPQKQIGESLCRHAWRLNLDADEVLTDTLRDELRDMFTDGAPVELAYAVQLLELMPGDRAPRIFAPRHVYVRLYHVSAGGFSASPAHDVVCLREGVRTKRLKGTIHHFTYRGIGSQIDKFNAYSDLLVHELRHQQRRIPTWRLFTEMPMAFFKAFILRRHCIRGVHGFITATGYAIFRFLRVAKHHELRRGESRIGHRESSEA